MLGFDAVAALPIADDVVAVEVVVVPFGIKVSDRGATIIKVKNDVGTR